MNQHQRPRLHLPKHILPLSVPHPLLPLLLIHHHVSLRKPRPLIHHKLRPAPIRLPHKPLRDRRPPMAPRQEGETSVLACCVLEGVPEAERGGGRGEEEG